MCDIHTYGKLRAARFSLLAPVMEGHRPRRGENFSRSLACTRYKENCRATLAQPCCGNIPGKMYNKMNVRERTTSLLVVARHVNCAVEVQILRLPYRPLTTESRRMYTVYAVLTVPVMDYGHKYIV